VSVGKVAVLVLAALVMGMLLGSIGIAKPHKQGRGYPCHLGLSPGALRFDRVPVPHRAV
jgi:hypothetical protein